MSEEYVTKDTFQMALQNIEKSSVKMEQSAERIEQALLKEVDVRTAMGRDIYKTKAEKKDTAEEIQRIDKRIGVVAGIFLTVILTVTGMIGGLYMFIVNHITKGITHIFGG